MRKSKKLPKGRDRHHLKNKCDGGSNSKRNLLLIHTDRHKNWHSVFGNADLDTVIRLLIRLRRAKQKQRNHSWR